LHHQCPEEEDFELLLDIDANWEILVLGGTWSTSTQKKEEKEHGGTMGKVTGGTNMEHFDAETQSAALMEEHRENTTDLDDITAAAEEESERNEEQLSNESVKKRRRSTKEHTEPITSPHYVTNPVEPVFSKVPVEETLRWPMNNYSFVLGLNFRSLA